MKKNHLILLLKITVSVCLIAYLFIVKVDIRQVFRAFSGVRPVWLLAGAALHIIGLLFSAFRWRFLLDAQSIRIPVGKLFTYYLVGHFFNMFLPTKVGGDLVRIYDTSRDHGSAVKPMAVVFVERISGMLTMLLIASVVVLMGLDVGIDIQGRFPWLKFVLGGFVLGLMLFPLLFHPVFEKMIVSGIFGLPVLRRVNPFIEKIFQAFREYAHAPKQLVIALGFGFLLQLNYFFHYFFLAKALGIEVSLMFFFVVIPVRTVVLMIPFFINGIGLREFFDITAFRLIGVSEHAAVAFAELAWFVQIGFALLGGILYMFRKRERQSTEAD